MNSLVIENMFLLALMKELEGFHTAVFFTSSLGQPRWASLDP